MKFGKPLFRYRRVKPPALTFVSQRRGRDGGAAQPLRELASLVTEGSSKV